MGSSDLISEKFAIYFATMNPLASKIYADIEGIEDYLKSNGATSITYNEKCSIEDKFLIHDHLGVNKNDSHNGKLNNRLSEYQKHLMNKSETSLNSFLDGKDGALISEAELLQPVFYNDSTLDQDHESVLLTSVAPKKPEKYVYYDNNYWIDEHSGTYSCCTTTQAKACKLQQFLDSMPAHPQVNKRNDHHPHKYRAPPIPTLKQEEDSYIIKPSSRVEVDEQDRYSKIDKIESEKSKYSVAVPVFGGLFGDAPPPSSSKKNDKNVKLQESENYNDPEDLPNQVQNKDLIAELQAKLKRGKPNSENSAMVGISPRSSAKLNKPKAPPPPPPGPSSLRPPGGAVKVTPNESKPRDTDFVVDVSSPCRIVTPKTGLDFLDNW